MNKYVLIVFAVTVNTSSI